MSRLLFVAPPFIGHLNPSASLAIELQKRAHEIGWVTDSGKLSRIAPSLTNLCGDTLTGLIESAGERPRNLRGPDAIKFFWDTCLAITKAMYPVVKEAIESFKPDLVLSDQQALSGAFAARECGLRWLTLATTPGEIGTNQSSYPGFHAWLMAMLSDLGKELALSHVDDPRFSPWGTLLFSSEKLTGDIPAHLSVRLVGCSVKHRDQSEPFPWALLDGRKKVLVSLGTVNRLAGREFLDTVWRACDERRAAMQTILIDPTGHLERTSTRDIILVRQAPQLSLLKHMQAVLSHGGQNTVSESLLHGLPLVIAPIRDDQPLIANQVLNAGAGVRVRFGRPDVSEVGAAIDAVLGNPLYRRHAEAISESMADGTDRAADAVELFLQSGSLQGCSK